MSHYFEIGQRYLALAMQVAHAFNVEQERLQLASVLDQATLADEAATRQALATLTRLQELIEKHQQALKKLIPSLVHELHPDGDEQALTALLRNTELAEIVPALKSVLDNQQAFYTNREHWLDAARQICELIEARRADLRFDPDGIFFVNGHDLQHFQMLWQGTDDALREEAQLLDERTRVCQHALRVLGQG